MSELAPFRCKGCNNLLGIGSDFITGRMYCDELCAEDYEAVKEESRNSLMEAIYCEVGISSTTLGDYFGLTRQRASQIILDRRNFK